MRNIRTTMAAAALMLALPAFASHPDDAFDPLDPALDALAITQDGVDTYGLTVEGDTVTATAAPSNVGGNSRVVFRPAAAIPSVNQVSCATWDDPQDHTRQPGAGLRIQYGDGDFRAVMISKNIWEHVYWTFNVHLVDTSHESPLTALGSANFDEALVPGGDLAPPPWRMCVAAIGLELAVKAWPEAQPEPGWDDQRHTARFDLPEGWDTPGHAGWYIGHLMADESATFSDVATTGMSLRGFQDQIQREIAAAVVISRP